MTEKISLLNKGPIPLYVQLAEVLVRRFDGNYEIGDKLPTVEQLVAEFGVSPVTVRQGMSLLEADGLISRGRGVGTLLLKKPEHRGRIRFNTSLDDLIESTRGTSSRILYNKLELPPEDLYPEFGNPAPAYRRMLRLHSLEGKAYALVDVYLDERLYQLLPEKLFEEETVICALKKLQPPPIASGRQRVRVSRATADAASWLEMSPDSPVAGIRRFLTASEEVVIYMAKVGYRADFVSLDMEFAI